MRFLSTSRARQRGIALVMAALSLVILGILATGFIVGSITEHRMSLNEIQATSAVQLADGGARAAFQWLVNSSSPPCQNSGTISPLGTMAIGTSGTAYPTITYADTNDCSNQYQGWGYTIRSVGTTGSQRNATVELKAIVQRKNFTCYAIYLGEYCPDPPGTAWFGDWDRVTGPVHSNCRLWLSQRDPPSWTGAQFWGRVTIVEPAFRLAGTPHYTSGDPACYASFYEGYETEVEGHDWPPSLSGTISCIGAMGGLTLTGETRLIFRPNGSVLIKNPHTQPYGGFWPQYVGTDHGGNIVQVADNDTLNLAYNGVFLASAGNKRAIRVRGPANVSPDIIVQGTYAGNWLLISQRDIVLIGDLMPAHDPRFGPSDDIMGLIPAEQAQGLMGKMMIPDIIPGYPNGIDGDRQLCAFVLVPYREGTWEVVDFSTRAREGILLLMGGVGFGCIGPTETSDFLHGYGTDIWYDGRACEKGTPPPCFPEMVSEQGNRPVWNVAQMDSSWREIY